MKASWFQEVVSMGACRFGVSKKILTFERTSYTEKLGWEVKGACLKEH
jgi:hypothetical protein